MSISDGKFQGIVVPIVTPLTPAGQIDAAGLRNLAGYLVESGVDGIFVMGTTGEFQYIADQDQLAAVEAVVDEVGSRIMVVAGVTGTSIEATVRNVIVLSAMPRPPHALVVAPLCYHSNRKLPQHMENLCQISGLPLVLYNNIGIVKRRWKRKDILPDLVGRIAGLDKIAGIKDSSGNLNYLSQILDYQSPSFPVFQGEESLILPALRMGALGAVPSIGNILPKVCVGLFKAFEKNNLETAKNYQRLINDTHQLYLKYGSVPRILKEYLVRKGVITSGYSHVPLHGEAARILDRIEPRIDSAELRL